MVPADTAACAALVVAEPFFADYGLTAEPCEHSLRAALDEAGHELRVADTAGRVDGFAWLMTHGAFGRAGYVRLLAIEPSRQSRGIGRLLMSALEDAHLNHRDLMLLASAHNTRARRFYERLGYQACGALPGFVRPGITECIYRKPRHPTV